VPHYLPAPSEPLSRAFGFMGSHLAPLISGFLPVSLKVARVDSRRTGRTEALPVGPPSGL